MMHILKVYKEYFDMIANKSKTIEYRLNDEKRKKIKVGHYITFKNISKKDENIVVKVVELKYYDNLLEMYTATFESDFKYEYSSPQEVVDDTTYYTKDERENHECVAIYFKLG